MKLPSFLLNIWQSIFERGDDKSSSIGTSPDDSTPMGAQQEETDSPKDDAVVVQPTDTVTGGSVAAVDATDVADTAGTIDDLNSDDSETDEDVSGDEEDAQSEDADGTATAPVSDTTSLGGGVSASPVAPSAPSDGSSPSSAADNTGGGFGATSTSPTETTHDATFGGSPGSENDHPHHHGGFGATSTSPTETTDNATFGGSSDSGKDHFHHHGGFPSDSSYGGNHVPGQESATPPGGAVVSANFDTPPQDNATGGWVDTPESAQDLSTGAIAVSDGGEDIDTDPLSVSED